MTVAVLVITHDNVGTSLIETASSTLGFCPLQSYILSVPAQCEPDLLTINARKQAIELNDGSGVLVLTDMYGSTPGNIACSLLDLPFVKVVSGVNLPMLIRVFNYPQLELEKLIEKAISGGREGIMDCHALNLIKQA